MSRRFAAGWLIAALCVAGGLPSGCGKDEPSGAPGGAKKPRIALVMKSLANEFFKTMEDGARAHQQARAGTYELVCNGIKDEQDVQRQMTIVEHMIAQQMDAIVIAPADSKAIVPVCKRALDAGIVVVNIDNKFDAGVLADKGVTIPFVGPDTSRPRAATGRPSPRARSSGASSPRTRTSRPSCAPTTAWPWGRSRRSRRSGGSTTCSSWATTTSRPCSSS